MQLTCRRCGKKITNGSFASHEFNIVGKRVFPGCGGVPAELEATAYLCDDCMKEACDKFDELVQFICPTEEKDG